MLKNFDLLPREKLQKRGLEALTDSDLVSVIIGSGSKFANVFEISKEVTGKLSLLKSKDSKGASSLQDLNLVDNIKGLGEIKAMRIQCAIELGRRLYWDGDLTAKIVCRQDVVNIMSYLGKRKREYAVVLLLDARNRLISKKTIAVGSLNKIVVEPRDVFLEAVKESASGIILVHNHPSGNTKPSISDIKFTERIKSAGKLLGIPLVDHVIV